MDKYSLNNDIEVKNPVDTDDETTIEKWAQEKEPEDMVEYDNLRLDKDAMARYLEIRKAREKNSRASGYHRKD